MIVVETSEEIPFSVELVWGLIAGFNSLQDYHPAVERSVLEKAGTERRITLTPETGGGVIVERLISFDDEAHSFSYRIMDLIDCSLPFKDYRSDVRVEATGDDRCTVYWTGTFRPHGTDGETAAGVARSIYQGCFDGIRSILSRRAVEMA